MTTHLTRREFVGAAAAASIPLLPPVAAADRIAVRLFDLSAPTQAAMDRDLLEVTIPRLEGPVRGEEVHRDPGDAVVSESDRAV